MTQGMHLMLPTSCSNWREVIMTGRIETGYSFTATNKPTWLMGRNKNNEEFCFIISSPNSEADDFSVTPPLDSWWPTRCHKHTDKISQWSDRRQIQAVETPCQRLDFRINWAPHFQWVTNRPSLQDYHVKHFPHTQSSVVFSRFL